MKEQVRLNYHRPPDRVDVFVQELLYADDNVLVTWLPETPLKRPLVIEGNIALDVNAPAIWFTFPGRMHDIGRFHEADGTFTGLYCNIMEPVTLRSRLEWSATDLFVDLWLPGGKDPRVLDRDELEQAQQSGWITDETAASAIAESERLLELYDTGAWPPPVVNEWPISRVTRDL